MRRTTEDRMQKKEFRMNLVNRIKDATPKDRARIVQEILETRYEIPFSKRTSIGKTTLYRSSVFIRASASFSVFILNPRFRM